MSKSDFHVVLYQPVIPQNTGSIARLCACTGATLHLIHPLGFKVDEASVRRAGLDYWEHVSKKEHESWQTFLAEESPEHLFLFTKFATTPYVEAQFKSPSYLVMGSETSGLPDTIKHAHAPQCYQIPIRRDLVRSLNLAQAAAIALYEAIRQTQRFPGTAHD